MKIKYDLMNEEVEEQEAMNVSNIKDQVWAGQLSHKEIIVNGEIKDDLIEKAVIQVFNINKYDSEQEKTIVGYQRTPIKIYINTFGGTADEAFSLISAIETSRTPVITIALGKCFSAGILILLAGHHRLAQKYTTFMLHQGSAGISGEFKKLFEYVDYCQKLNTKVENYIYSKCKITKKQMEKVLHTKHDWFLDTEEALKLKIIDGIY